MLRFDTLIRPGMTLRDVRQFYPQVGPVLDSFGFRQSCADCSIEVVARKYGLRSDVIVLALNEAVFGPMTTAGLTH
ncbi:MAG TPA: hypothetical protein DEH78_30890 [Solibacterales bacterium]|nr:hypothetical protein [Bryobacterales bacterium]